MPLPSSPEIRLSLPGILVFISPFLSYALPSVLSLSRCVSPTAFMHPSCKHHHLILSTFSQTCTGTVRPYPISSHAVHHRLSLPPEISFPNIFSSPVIVSRGKKIGNDSGAGKHTTNVVFALSYSAPARTACNRTVAPHSTLPFSMVVDSACSRPQRGCDSRTCLLFGGDAMRVPPRADAIHVCECRPSPKPLLPMACKE